MRSTNWTYDVTIYMLLELYEHDIYFGSIFWTLLQYFFNDFMNVS